MIESSAKELIEEIFSNEFDRDNFIKFTNKFFTLSFNSSIVDGNAIPNSFREHIQSLECLATYTDENNKEIDLLIVKLLRDTALDRARNAKKFYSSVFRSYK